MPPLSRTVPSMLGIFLGGLFGDVLSRRDRRWYMWVPALGQLVSVPGKFGLHGDAGFKFPDQVCHFTAKKNIAGCVLNYKASRTISERNCFGYSQ